MQKDNLLPAIEAFIEDRGLPVSVVSTMIFGDRSRISLMRAGRILQVRNRAKVINHILENASAALKRRLRHEELPGGYHTLTVEPDPGVEEHDSGKERRPYGR